MKVKGSNVVFHYLHLLSYRERKGTAFKRTGGRRQRKMCFSKRKTCRGKVYKV